MKGKSISPLIAFLAITIVSLFNVACGGGMAAVAVEPAADMLPASTATLEATAIVVEAVPRRGSASTVDATAVPPERNTLPAATVVPTGVSTHSKNPADIPIPTIQPDSTTMNDEQVVDPSIVMEYFCWDDTDTRYSYPITNTEWFYLPDHSEACPGVGVTLILPPSEGTFYVQYNNSDMEEFDLTYQEVEYGVTYRDTQANTGGVPIMARIYNVRIRYQP